MPFCFTLQAVLRWRESYERRERQRLEAITRELIRARAQLEQSKRERATALQRLQRSLTQGMIAGEMHFELASERVRARQFAAWSDRVATLKDLRQRQLVAFRKAQQQRKILENLRDRQLTLYKLDQVRRAQQQIDDGFLHTRPNTNTP